MLSYILFATPARMNPTRYSENEVINNKILEIAAIADQLPGIIIIHSLTDNTLMYMSDWGLSGLDLKWEDVAGMDMEEYHARYFNPEYAEHYVPKILALLDKNSDETVSFFQQVRKSEASDWQWYTTSIKIFMRDPDNKPMLSTAIAIPLESNHFFAAKAARLLEENIFLRNNLDRFASLSTRERDVLAQMARGKSSPEIAGSLHISVNTAETHRRNIKQKLNVKNSFEIAQYARAFDLI